jgi:hypothetical protein
MFAAQPAQQQLTESCRHVHFLFYFRGGGDAAANFHRVFTA